MVNCLGLTDLFYKHPDTDEYEDIDRIKALCQSCDNQCRCLDAAISNTKEQGFWARTDVTERKIIRKFIEQEHISYLDELGILLSSEDKIKDYYYDESAMFVV